MSPPFIHVAWPTAVAGLAVRSTAAYQNSTEASSHAVTLPSGIVAGDLLLMIARAAYNRVCTTPTGWTEVLASTDTGFGVAHVFARVADGNEGATVTVDISSAARIATNTYCISGWAGTIATDVDALFSAANSADPPSLTAGWGAADNLWIAGYTSRRCDWTQVAPTDYGNLIEAVNTPPTATSMYVGVASARRMLNAATENPATFATVSRDAYNAVTIAVRPAA